MFQKVLIANRGAISCRIQKTLLRLGITPVAIYSEADRESLHALECSEKIALKGNTPQETYLNGELIIALAKEYGVEAIHPGYGFLSENSSFATLCAEADIVFLGPTPDQLDTCGLKHLCRDIAAAEGVPLLSGSGLLHSVEQAVEEANAIGYPVMIKSSAGGGGIGMQIAKNEAELRDRYDQVLRLSHSNFDDSSIFLEKYIERARHIEVQVFGDGRGNVITLGERDCSTQRRNQKVVEESPAPNLLEAERQQLYLAAKRIALSVNYQSAGTVEFLWDDIAREFYFLEVNARLQVEHGVTEEVWGVDIVEWMVRLGAGDFRVSDYDDLRPSGHSVQVRVYAEDPKKNFQPSVGLINALTFDEQARCETWVQSGTEVSPFYDPMLAKLITHGASRAEAVEKLHRVVEASSIYGVETNLRFLSSVLASRTFEEGEVHTKFLDSFSYSDRRIEVLDAGVESMIQDYPGRTGMWDVGVPPSGPFDALHFRVSNLLLGNEADAAVLECTIRGASLKFGSTNRCCLAGADMSAKLNGKPVALTCPFDVKEGDKLVLGSVSGPGLRCYLAFEGGLDVPIYLGSRATFRLGKFGGHSGRELRVGDILHTNAIPQSSLKKLEKLALPELSSNWDIYVTYGPHGAPDFLTDEDVEAFFDANWEVHYNSDRTGIRLIGPKPDWARKDGGEAGLHPSNIHDNAYTVGSVDFTGDMPIILGPDGPSLGGFVCPVVVIQSNLWKLGQLKAGDKIKFHPITNESAEAKNLAHETVFEICNFNQVLKKEVAQPQRKLENPIVEDIQREGVPRVVYRQSGDGVLLVEFGDMELDLDLRFRAQALYDDLKKVPFSGLLEMVPGIRSLQVQYDTLLISQREVVDELVLRERALPCIEDMEFESRIVHLPLCWDDPSTQLAIEKYTQIVREDAPWCPSNIEFIRRVNGCASVEEVRDIVYQARYFVMGLGDVYLGAPVATPLDPRHRLVTTKYNPARTWTPENAVGIGGAYLCIYGMEGPGGYQFVGRTLPIWNRYHQTELFEQPWLLRFFDQIQWYPVSESELHEIRQDFLTGQYSIKVEPTVFKVREYHEFLKQNSEGIEEFRARQKAAFDAERQDWERTGAMNFSVQEFGGVSELSDTSIGESEQAVLAPITGSLWKVKIKEGDSVEAGELLFIVESMKTEFSVLAEQSGVVGNLFVEEGSSVKVAQVLASITPEELAG